MLKILGSRDKQAFDATLLGPLNRSEGSSFGTAKNLAGTTALSKQA